MPGNALLEVLVRASVIRLWYRYR